MTSDATNGTMEKDKRIATIKITIRHARRMFMIPTPFCQIGICAHLLKCVFTFFCA